MTVPLGSLMETRTPPDSSASLSIAVYSTSPISNVSSDGESLTGVTLISVMGPIVGACRIAHYALLTPFLTESRCSSW